MVETRQHDITETMQRRKSGLLVPETVEPEVCPHPDGEVDRRRSSYFCRKCRQVVLLVTVHTAFMTPLEMALFQRAQKMAKTSPA